MLKKFSRPLIILGISLVCILLVLSFVIFPYAKSKVGDLRPALFSSEKYQERSENTASGLESNIVGKLADARLTVPEEFLISEFATGTPGARDLQFSPNGTLLVSLRAEGKIVALPDTNNDGQADKVVEVLTGLRNPHGLAFRNGKLFVAEEQQVNRYLWDENQLTANLEKKLFDTPEGVTLPGGGGGHQTRSLTFDQKGNLYISIGSTCNVCLEKNQFNATVMITDEAGSNPRIYSKGLRNAVFLATNPQTDQVWVTEMGRDLLGDNIPPDEINILQDNSDFGWPYCYGRQIYDQNFGKESAAYCQYTLPPIFELPAHSAPLGLAFIESADFPKDWQGDLLVAYHGSWNRSEPTGYKIVRLDVEGNTIKSESDFMTGFLQGSSAIGRPVDMAFNGSGSLFVSDDKSGRIYRITARK